MSCKTLPLISLFTSYFKPSSGKGLTLWGFSIQAGLGQHFVFNLIYSGLPILCTAVYYKTLSSIYGAVQTVHSDQKLWLNNHKIKSKRKTQNKTQEGLFQK